MMEPEYMAATTPASGSSGILHDFLSRFAAACRGDLPATLAGASQDAQMLHETKCFFVSIIGDIFFRCSAHLAQVCSAFDIFRFNLRSDCIPSGGSFPRSL